ncbi:hypothetical protein [Candidatus Viridilinea mediisalina]|uniref:Uncharacterized protein n=1 Tax=Candidatus Viridilinea mediisalina TaxID=2024553 RepID=A0A2A6RM64_9CHLR|nr:hypothetical protein [Candidatus Viridilinea mediisalina]PDW03950.1 hypothetical protein CJ255_06240 [Candidatus Viridilinea mediisalina]
MRIFFVTEAYQYYNQHINRQDRFRLLIEHNFSIVGSIHPIDWELFGSILTGEPRNPGYGSDLGRYEIKSAVEGSSFEYQYHLHSGQKKLEDDMEIDHIFISYSKDYSRVSVKMIQGAKLKPYFEQWKEGLIANYQGDNRKQRFRKNISYGVVVKKAEMIMMIDNYRLVQL